MKFWRLWILVGLLALVLTANVGAQMRKVAVVDFEDRTGKGLRAIGAVANELISVGLAKSGLFDVVERAKLKTIMEEHTLSISGLVDSERNMLTLGKLLNADAIITGVVLEFSEKRLETVAYGVKTVKQNYHLEVSVKELDVNTSKIAFADIYTADYDLLLAGNAHSTTDDVHRELLRKALTKAIDAMVAQEKTKGQPVVQEVTVTVHFESDPGGADVVVDGIYCGATPLDLQIREGVHVIKITKGGYTPWENKVKIFQGMQPISVSLAPVPPPTTN